MSRNGRNSVFFLLLAIALTTGFAFQGSRGLFESTEGRYAECAREMLVSGNWLEPTLDGKHHWTKPPMTYWAIAGGMLVFGQNEWGARFHLSVCFVATILLVTALAGRMWKRRTGIIAGLVYATSIFPAAASNMLSTDNLLTFWEVAAVTCYYFAFSASSMSHSRRWIFGMWLLSGFAFLTKGPPGLIFMSALIPFHVIQRKRGHDMASFLNIPGILMFSITGFGWFLWENHLHSGLLASLVGNEVIARVATDKFHRNPQWYAPFIIYLPIMLLGCAPWVFFWRKAARRVFGRFSLKNIAKSTTESPNRLFLALWALIPLVIFSLAKSRLALYVLPLMAPLAIATARAIEVTFDKNKLMSKVTRIALVSASFLVALKLLGALFPAGRVDMKNLHNALEKEANGKRYEVALFEEDLMWGLQFYQKRHIDRIGDETNEWADKTLKDKLDEIVTSGDEKVIFVVKPSHSKKLIDDLKAHDIEYTIKLTPGGWNLVTIPALKDKKMFG